MRNGWEGAGFLLSVIGDCCGDLVSHSPDGQFVLRMKEGKILCQIWSYY